MAEHPHARIARRLWEAAASGDSGAVDAFYAPDLVWRAYGRNPFRGEYRGMAAVTEYLGRLGEAVDDLRSDLRGIYAGDQGAVIHYHAEVRRGLRRFEGEYFLWLRIGEGLVEEVALLPFDQEAEGAFWRAD